MLIYDHQGDEEMFAALRTFRLGIPPNAQVIYSGRNVVSMVPGTPFCIKSFKQPGFIKGYIYAHYRWPKAARAYYNAQRLLELGISTPTPFYAEINYNRWGVADSYYVCRYLSGWHELRGIEHLPEFKDICHGLACLMLTLRYRLVYVVDFTQGNILYKRRPDGSYEFSLVDINRIVFDDNDPKLYIHHFRSVLDTREGVEALARDYARMGGYLEEPFVARALAIYDKHQKHLWRKRRFKERFLKRFKR